MVKKLSAYIHRRIHLTMLELDFTPFPVLSTERLVLRKITREDAEEIFFLRSDKRVLQFIDRNPAKSIDEAVQWIDMIEDAIKNNESIAWAMCLKTEPALIGTIVFWNIQKAHFRAEIGYVFHPSFHGRGLMQEAMIIVLDYGFRVDASSFH
jgi:ribosomal-protein-alanine N-acetyltransferase